MSVAGFEVSAPGKVILHGEHSVVYGKPAIAGPIGLRTYLTYKRLQSPEVILDFASIPFNSSLSLESFNAFLAQFDCHSNLQPLEFLEKMRSADGFPFASFVTRQPAQDSIKEKFSFGTALYLLNRILRSEGVESLESGFQLTLKSVMSIGAGLGSSAGYGVCVSAGAFLLSKIIKGELEAKFALQDSPEVLEKISKWAFDSEIVMHERPSGIDNTICTYGNLIKFKRGEPFESLKLRQQVNILIVDTGVSRTTAKLVAGVADLKSRHPGMMDAILDAMGHLVDDVVSILEDDGDRFEALRTLVSINGNLLRAIGVSHPSLERIFRLAEESGFSAKLTGAGGGGCALVFLPQDYESSKEYAELTQNLTKAGFHWIQTTIGGQGVQFKALE
ncbi:mevalonate kinase [Culex quinquefasciatus]|uniref:Mevalonate kinase n=1 Tax=Culex quinquefasciatus TaxID=7176 RepID=B0WBY0_CULQU|nr:mevalonate kinase [Culex quinquefasciatus]|eukprot:XP_001846214.1 mevalonate kinase [Culex quinquefasciatus]